MTLYPTLRRRGRATLAADAVVLLLVALFAWLGLRVHDAVADLAGLGRGVEQAGVAVGGAARDAAGALRDGFGAAAGAVGGAPVIGGPVAGALREGGAAAARPVQSQGAARARALIAAGREEQAQVHRTANLLGWLAFLVPTLGVLAAWAPLRVRQMRSLTPA